MFPYSLKSFFFLSIFGVIRNTDFVFVFPAFVSFYSLVPSEFFMVMFPCFLKPLGAPVTVRLLG